MTDSRADRIPCINPRCRRTADAAKYNPGAEIVCGKCFRVLPAAIRAEYRSLRRRWKKLLRLIARRTAADHGVDYAQINRLRDRMLARVEANWRRIKNYFVAPERPIGIEGFLQEVGL